MGNHPATDDAKGGGGDRSQALLRLVGALSRELRPGGAPAAARPGLDSRLDRDLGFDSLGRIELLARVERTFEVSLPDSVFNRAETPRDLLRALQAAEAAGDRPLRGTPEVIAEDRGGAVALPDDAETLIEVLDAHLRATPDRPTIRLYADDGDGEAITYRQLHDGAARIAAGLQDLGLHPGEAVAIMLPTGADYFRAFFGALLAGGVPVPLYPPGRPSQIEEHLRRHARIVANAAAPILVTTAEALPFARLMGGLVDSLRQVVAPVDLEGDPAALRPVHPQPGDIALIQYTSGSTGDPKGVALSHANLLANIRAMGRAMEVTADDVFVSWLPLYHDMGLIGAWLGTFYHATLLVIMSPLTFLARPQRWLWALHRHRGTLTACPNFAVELCVRRVRDEDIAGLDLGALRFVANGAEAVSARTVDAFCERYRAHGFRRVAMKPVYGLAESSVGLTFPPLDAEPRYRRLKRDVFARTGEAVAADDADPAALVVVNCGRPLPGHEIRIVDDGGRELPENREGHVQFRGPSATAGYFRNAEATQALFDGDWLRSGDLGFIEGGNLYVTGRRKDIVIRAGRNIYPAELEDAIGDLDGVIKGNVAAFASPDPETASERLVVVVETRRREDEGRRRLNEAIQALAVDLVDLPADEIVLVRPNSVLKTSSGKIRRDATRQLYERGLLDKPRPTVRWQILRLGLAGLLPRLRRAGTGAAAWAVAGYTWTVFGLFAVALWALVVALPRPAMRWRTLRGGLRLLARLSGIRLMIQGIENLPPPDSPCLFAANHSSYLDAFVLCAALPRPLAFLAKAELQASGPVRLVLSRLGTLFVERSDHRKGAEDARRIAEAARAGQPLTAFPEGTFTRMPGLLPFRMGAFAAAVEAGVPVVPVTLRGTRNILRGDSWFPRPGPVVVTIDPPLAPEPPEPDAWAASVRLRDAVRERILRRCGEPDLAHEQPPI